MNKLGRTPTAAVTRFWLCVNKDGPVHPVLGTACWVWTARLNSGGYGRFYTGKQKDALAKNMQAHRWVYEHTFGVVLKDSDDQVLHKCDNRQCVNPEHLFRGTHLDNMQDKVKKGRQPRGDKHGRTLITEEQARYILAFKKRREPETLKQLAARLGVSLSAIMHIRQGHNWKHLQPSKADIPAETQT